MRGRIVVIAAAASGMTRANVGAYGRRMWGQDSKDAPLFALGSTCSASFRDWRFWSLSWTQHADQCQLRNHCTALPPALT